MNDPHSVPRTLQIMNELTTSEVASLVSQVQQFRIVIDSRI